MFQIPNPPANVAMPVSIVLIILGLASCFAGNRPIKSSIRAVDERRMAAKATWW